MILSTSVNSCACSTCRACDSVIGRAFHSRHQYSFVLRMRLCSVGMVVRIDSIK